MVATASRKEGAPVRISNIGERVKLLLSGGALIFRLSSPWLGSRWSGSRS